MSPSLIPTTTTTTSEQFKLVHLTDQEIIDFTRFQNSLAWKGCLSEKDYVLREYVLSKSKITSSGNNKLYVYMLKSSYNDGDNDDEPLCSIELLVRDSLKFEYDKDARGHVKQTNVLSGCIGGVFTYPQQRGKGYARIMVNKLVELAKRDLVGSDRFMFLYSEIGEYYAKNGFKSFPVDLINIPLKGEVGTSGNSPQVDYELVEYHQFQDLMRQYRVHFEQEMVAKVKQDHKTRVSIKPTSDLIDWFHLRAKFITHKLLHEPKGHTSDFNNEYETIKDRVAQEPKIFGLKIKLSNGEIAGFIVWTIDWLENGDANYVTILKAVAFDKEAQDEIVLNLIKLAIHQLVHYPILGKPTINVKLWELEISDNVGRKLIELWPGTETRLENSSRSGILINNPEEEEQLKKGQLIWEENTKLPWF